MLKSVNIVYQCPVCERKCKTSLLVTQSKVNGEHPLTLRINDCSHCGSRHKIDYTLKEDNGYCFTKLNFTIDQRQYDVKIKLSKI